MANLPKTARNEKGDWTFQVFILLKLRRFGNPQAGCFVSKYGADPLSVWGLYLTAFARAP
jgi:hypothetical protein